MERFHQCPCLGVLRFSFLCIPLFVFGFRNDADTSIAGLAMVARGKDLAEFAAKAEENARLHADQLGSVESLDEPPAHLAGKNLAQFASNVENTARPHADQLGPVESFAELATGDTPPCPWQAHLNNDGKVVGAGSFGEVFTATVKCESSFKVAIKKIIPAKGTVANVALNEAKIMETFSSPNFVKVYGMGKSLKNASNVRYILMEAAQGGSLSKYVKNAGSSQDAFQTAVGLFIDALEGLVEMHDAQYLHRDIKPENILVTEKRSSGKRHAKIADLGESCHQSKCTGVAGTPYYMAPELLLYQFNARRNDVWSMGLVLYEILNGGKLPQKFLNAPKLHNLYVVIKSFNFTAPEEYQRISDSGLQGRLKGLLAAMLNPDVDTRIASYEALDWALREVKQWCGFPVKGVPLCETKASKIEQLLPACWNGESDWSPNFPIKKQLAQQQPQKPTQPVTKTRPVTKVERPVVDSQQLPQEDPIEVGVHMHEHQFSPGPLGAELIAETGAIETVQSHSAFGQKQIHAGWFVDKVCGKPYSFELLQQAIAGECDTDPYTIVFREPEAEQLLPDDPGGMKKETRQKQQATIKVFHLKSPRTVVATAYIFKNNRGKDAYVSEQGIVQNAWARLKKEYKTNIPLKPGDEIISVNNNMWDNLVDDNQFKSDAMSGQLGKLTFLYLAAESHK